MKLDDSHLLITTPRKNFPYAERFCRYCEQPLKIIKAIHIAEWPEHYKAILVCDNDNCGAYDEEGHAQYVRLYYSDDYAHMLLKYVTIEFFRRSK